MKLLWKSKENGIGWTYVGKETGREGANRPEWLRK
jgi:hypothetical protein